MIRPLPLVFLLACASDNASAPIAVDTSSWLAEVVTTPSSFAALTTDNRSGWVALHRSDLQAAVDAFPVNSTGEVRARIARQAVYSDLVAITHMAVLSTLEQWEERGLPTEDGIRGIVPLWRHCGGPQRLPSAEAPIPFDGLEIPEWAEERVALYDSLAEGADPSVARGLIAVPILQTEDRTIRDPCLLALLTEDGPTLLAQLAPTEGLAARFLSAILTAEDLSSEVARPATPGTLGAHSPSLPPMTATDLPSLQADVDALDTALEDLRTRVSANATPEGSALLVELSLMERLRQDALVARTRELTATHPLLAVALADIAWDATDRSVGPLNSAGAATSRARALLAAGRTREALNALEPLLDVLPEAAGAREWVADLAVLEALDRSGASKEE